MRANNLVNDRSGREFTSKRPFVVSLSNHVARAAARLVFRQAQDERIQREATNFWPNSSNRAPSGTSTSGIASAARSTWKTKARIEAMAT